MEIYALGLLLVGLAIGAVAWIWLIARAFAERLSWGLGSLVIPPVALWFALRHAQKSVGPLVLFVLGSLVTAVPVSYGLLAPSDLGVRQTLDEVPKLWTLAGMALQSDAAHEWMEGRAFYMQSGGLLVAALAWLWLLVRAFRQDRRWGLGSLFIPPVGLIFAGRHPHRGIGPVIVMMISLLVTAIPALYVKFVPLDLGERERLVNGEQHLTLTGWDRKNYSLLKYKPDTVVLQMANPDVTDGTLEPVKEMKALQELDLNGTQITDAGLDVLKGLPALARLRLARTKITDQGFQKALFAKASLMMLDLSGTKVSRETTKSWREAKPGRRVMQ